MIEWLAELCDELWKFWKTILYVFITLYIIIAVTVAFIVFSYKTVLIILGAFK